jgi:hypothetical protein
MTAVPRTSGDCQCLHALRESNVGHSSQTVNAQVTNGRQQRKGGCDKLCTTTPLPSIDPPHRSHSDDIALAPECVLD